MRIGATLNLVVSTPGNRAQAVPATLGNLIREREVMRLRFLGKHSSPGNSPTLWDTDADKYVIMGYLPGADALAQIGTVPVGEGVIWVPKALMRYLPEDKVDGSTQPGSVAASP